MLFFQFQEPDLLIKSLAPVKPGAADDLPDILQGKFQLPEQKDLLQGLQIRFVIQAVPGLRMPGRMKPSDPVVLLQGADTHACKPAHFLYSHHHGCPPYF